MSVHPRVVRGRMVPVLELSLSRRQPLVALGGELSKTGPHFPLLQAATPSGRPIRRATAGRSRSTVTLRVTFAIRTGIVRRCPDGMGQPRPRARAWLSLSGRQSSGMKPLRSTWRDSSARGASLGRIPAPRVATEQAHSWAPCSRREPSAAELEFSHTETR